MLTQPRSEVKDVPHSLGASWHLGKEVVFLEMEWGSNHEPIASKEDAVSTSARPTWRYYICRRARIELGPKVTHLGSKFICDVWLVVERDSLNLNVSARPHI